MEETAQSFPGTNHARLQRRMPDFIKQTRAGSHRGAVGSLQGRERLSGSGGTGLSHPGATSSRRAAYGKARTGGDASAGSRGVQPACTVPKHCPVLKVMERFLHPRCGLGAAPGDSSLQGLVLAVGAVLQVAELLDGERHSAPLLVLLLLIRGHHHKVFDAEDG